jgi:hypothetical protein
MYLVCKQKRHEYIPSYIAVTDGKRIQNIVKLLREFIFLLSVTFVSLSTTFLIYGWTTTCDLWRRIWENIVWEGRRVRGD